MERLLLTGRACTDRHGAGACTVTCQVVIFVCRGELDGELVATWTDRAAARTDAEEGSRDRWSMTPPVWIREHGVRACVLVYGRRVSGKEEERIQARRERARNGGDQGSGLARIRLSRVTSEGFRCAFTLRAFLSFPFLYLSFATRFISLARADVSCCSLC